MSRVFTLAMTEDEVVRHCRDKKIAISALEALPGGGTRLVCMSGYGAEKIRSSLKSRMIEGNVQRQPFRPVTPLW